MKLQNELSSESSKYHIYCKSLLYSCDINVGCENNNQISQFFAYGNVRLGPKKAELNAKAEFVNDKNNLEFIKGIYEVQGASILYRYFAKDVQLYCQKREDEFLVVTEDTSLLKNPVDPLTFIFSAVNSLERKEDNAFDLVLGEKIEKIYFKYDEKVSELWRNKKLVAKISGGPTEWNIEYKMFHFKAKKCQVPPRVPGSP